MSTDKPRSDVRPVGAQRFVGLPDPGTLIVHDHTVYRVVLCEEIPEHAWSEDDHDAWMAGMRIPYLLEVTHVDTGERLRFRDRARRNRHTDALCPRFWIFPTEHYPVCVSCGGLSPCREEQQRQEAEAYDRQWRESSSRVREG